jgi:hypothetical protein
MSPESNTSSSGLTPASRIAPAMIVTFLGVLITTALPNHMVLRSSEQISGPSATTCSTRRSGRTSVEPGAATLGSSSLGMNRPPGPVVRLMIRSVSLARMRSTTSR